MAAVDLASIWAAHERIRPYVHRTPVLRSSRLDEIAGVRLFFKCENFQKVGAFKARGACNAVFSLPEAEARRGVVTHSSGNHGAALAYAARARGVSATVVVPENAPPPKLKAIAGYGARIVPCAPTVAAREAAARRLVEEEGLVLIHPFDNDDVIAGQGTAGLELLEDQPRLDAVLAPVGGGGLLSGLAIAAKGLRPGIRVYGGEPRGADDAARSLASGNLVLDQVPQTICDGLRTTLAPRTFNILRAQVDGIGVASEEGIVAAMRLIWENLKIIVEPSCCPPLAAILENTLKFPGQNVGLVLTGGNVDLENLPWRK